MSSKVSLCLSFPFSFELDGGHFAPNPFPYAPIHQGRGCREAHLGAVKGQGMDIKLVLKSHATVAVSTRRFLVSLEFCPLLPSSLPLCQHPCLLEKFAEIHIFWCKDQSTAQKYFQAETNQSVQEITFHGP